MNALNYKSPITIGVILLGVFSIILFFHSAYYFPFLSDDSLISLRYSARLLEGKGLTWTDGIAVEGYSNLLWVLIISALGFFGMDLVDATRALGFFGMVLIMLSVLLAYLNNENYKRNTLAIGLALLFLALSAPIAVWAIGGLEQPLYGGLIALTLPLVYQVLDSNKIEKKALLLLSFCLGLICLTRPDGPLFTVCCASSFFLIGLLSKNNAIFKSAFLILPISVGLFLAQLGFRLYYYGEFVPNTALVKLAPSSHHFLNGYIYLKSGLISLAPFSFIAIATGFALLFSKRSRYKALVLLSFLLSWSAYIVFIGGDIFPAYRHFIPLIVVFAFILTEGSVRLITMFQGKRKKILISLSLFTYLLLIPFSFLQANEDRNKSALYERWEWDGKKIAETLKSAFEKKQPLIAVTAAGCLPYWSDLPSLDMLGLNDYYLPRNPPKDFGKGYLGHELGNGQYVLDRNPDIIIFHMGMGPIFRSGQELKRSNIFKQNYLPTKVKIQGLNKPITIYFNKYGPQTGISKKSDEIVIPGYLLQHKGSVIKMNAENNLVSTLQKDVPLSLKFKLKSSENWQVKVKTANDIKVDSELLQLRDTTILTLKNNSSKRLEIESVTLNLKESS